MKQPPRPSAGPEEEWQVDDRTYLAGSVSPGQSGAGASSPQMRPRHKQPGNRTLQRIQYLNLICKMARFTHCVCTRITCMCVYVLISPSKMRRGPGGWQVMHFTFNKLTLQCVRTYKQGVSSLEINGLWGEEQCLSPPRVGPTRL